MEAQGSSSGVSLKAELSKSNLALKRPSPSASDCEDISADVTAKRLRIQAEANLQSLPSRVLQRILTFCGLEELTSLGLSCRRLSMASLSFLMTPASTRTIFPFLLSTEAITASELTQREEDVLYVLSKPFTVTPNMGVKAKFVKLGLALKKLTCLMPTVDRIEFLCLLLSRLDFKVIQDGHMVQNKLVFSWIGALLHTFVLGWADKECQKASSLLVMNMRERGELSTLLDEDYELGDYPELEIFYRQYWVLVFRREVRAEGQVWLDSLLQQTSAGNNKMVARVLLIMSSPANEDIDHVSFGIHWTDHLEAVPATLNVANNRYRKLIHLLQLVRSGSLSGRFNKILQSIFTTAGSWLPESVGSVLLLLGDHVAAQYLHFLSRGCEDCLQPFVSTAMVGLAVMTVR